MHGKIIGMVLLIASVCFSATTSVRIYQQVGNASSYQNKQIGIDTVPDAALGWRMWSGKDAVGAVTKWLAKDKPARVDTLTVTGGANLNRVYIDSIRSLNHFGTMTGDSIRSTAINASRLYYGTSRGDTAVAYKDTSRIKSSDSTYSRSISAVRIVTDSLRSTAIDADRIYYNGIYGDIHNHDTTSTQSVPTGATYTNLTFFPSMGPASGVTVDTANDKLIILTPGSYRVGISLSFGGTANVTWNIAAFLGGVEQESVHFARKLGSGGDVGNANASGIIDVVSVPVDLDVRARHDAGGSASITAIYTNLNTNYLGK